MMEFNKEIIESTIHSVNCSKEQAVIILEEIERQKRSILSDLSMYANHLKQNYQIGSMSPFHKLVKRIEVQLKDKEDGWYCPECEEKQLENHEGVTHNDEQYCSNKCVQERKDKE